MFYRSFGYADGNSCSTISQFCSHIYSACVYFLFLRSLFNCSRSSSYTLLYSTISLSYYLIPIFSALLSYVCTHRSFFSLTLFHHYFSFYFSLSPPPPPLSFSLPSNFLSLLQLSSLILSFFHNFLTYLFSIFPFIRSINVYQMDTTRKFTSLREFGNAGEYMHVLHKSYEYT